MKNTVISVICIFAVFIYSFFTTFYVNDFSKKMNNLLPASESSEYVNTEININDLVNIYENKKYILTFIINRENTDKLEEIIINLENSIKYNDEQNTNACVQLLRSTLNSIVTSNSFTL